MQFSKRASARRGLGASLSGALVLGAAGFAVVGAAAPASAAEVTGDYKYQCQVDVSMGSDSLDLGVHEINVHMKTTVEPPLVPGQEHPEQAVTITLTMAKALHQATVSLLQGTAASGGSPDSSVIIDLPVFPALGGSIEQTIPLLNVVAPKKKVPALTKEWKIVSTGIVPAIPVPGFADQGDPADVMDSVATVRMPDNFTVEGTIHRPGTDAATTIKCADPDERLVGHLPIHGPYVDDSVDRHAQTQLNKPVDVSIVSFDGDTPTPVPSQLVQEPANGTFEVKDPTTGTYTYTPNDGFVGTDLITYTGIAGMVSDTGTVRIDVAKATSKLNATLAAKSVKFGKVAKVKATLESAGAKSGKVTLHKGKKKLGTATLKGGAATLKVARFALPRGKHDLTVKFSGNATSAKSSTAVKLTVAKATPKMVANVKTKRIVVNKTKTKVRVNIKPQGLKATGKVRVMLKGSRVGSAKVKDGKAVLRIKKFKKNGKQKLTVVYSGNKNVAGKKTAVTVRVKKK